MTIKNITKADYVFEASWEVCNMIGGIHTAISTKAVELHSKFKNNLIFIGPDVWKETEDHPEFIEDKSLFRAWREKASESGLHFKTGHWRVEGEPQAILIDFTAFFNSKDVILTELWDEFGLDSLSGQWDYIEPVMFGYAAGRTIQSFYDFYLTAEDKIIAHFHEWMSGAGVLHLKKHVPQAATVFTAHSTILGRSIANRELPLYDKLQHLDASKIAEDLDVSSKHSLEALSAANADIFTSVSDRTSIECEYLLKVKPDLITPNGFIDFKANGDKESSRELLKNVAELVSRKPVSDSAYYVLMSGRYEYHNKGMNSFIDAISELKNKNQDREIVAYIMVPGNHAGPRKDIQNKLNGIDSEYESDSRLMTHLIHDREYDKIYKRLEEKGLVDNSGGVKVIFTPSYLDGKDGIFNRKYYQILAAFDLTVFPSYYEPWGYTPMESIAFKVPTITTTLSGFGRWAIDNGNKQAKGVSVLERTDQNYDDFVNTLTKSILMYTSLDLKAQDKASDSAFELSRKALWSNQIHEYYNAYEMAVEKANGRAELYADKYSEKELKIVSSPMNDQPNWKKLFIQHYTPKKLTKLKELSSNLWWSWNFEAHDLFEMIDADAWAEHLRNPIPFLESLSLEKLKSLEKDEVFLKKLEEVYLNFENYMSTKHDPKTDSIAYYSMEFGLHDSLKIFSGGLGVLAGDYLKEASDSNENMIGIGLLYRYGYFTQSINIHGDQESQMIPQKFSHLPVAPVRDEDGKWVTVSVALPGRVVKAKIWRCDVGRIPLFLMDTDIEENQPKDQTITHQLYGGDSEHRLKQELLLGVGGIRLLEELKINPAVYHCNEGHAAFIGVERLRKFVQETHLSFYQALEVVRASTLFTTHTPVPAGHDAFEEDLMRTYIPHYPDRLNISWDTFINLGKVNPNTHGEKFSMSNLAVRLSQEVNGVSEIHGRVSKKMFNNLYPGYFASESHIDYVTNGVHFPFWTSRNWRELYEKQLGHEHYTDQSNPKHWEKIYDVDDSVLWNIRNKQRKELVDYLKVRIARDMRKRQESPKLISETVKKLDDNTLTIGFARRFATYKRAQLLFTNIERLGNLVNDKERPIRFIFAGKAHPHDKMGQDLIKNIIKISKSKEFIGKVFFVENYDMELGQKLTQGVDVWLNNPTRPLEASGTSGEKAIMNGVLNFSVLDGWWAEGYKKGAGWALDEERVYENQEFQNLLDAETMYNLFETEIIPSFYNRTKDVPTSWIQSIKKNIHEIVPHFTMKRMLDDYRRKFYTPLKVRSASINANGFEKAFSLSAWKRNILRSWDEVELISMKVPDSTNEPLCLGDSFEAELELKLNSLKGVDLGVEVIFGSKKFDVVDEITEKHEMEVKRVKGDRIKYHLNIPISSTGVYDYAFRVYPKHPDLPNRQDFPLVKWI